jgi:hypothetical protein
MVTPLRAGVIVEHPAKVLWLFGSGPLGLIGVTQRKAAYIRN